VTEAADILDEYHKANEIDWGPEPPIFTSPDGKWKFDYDKRQFVPNKAVTFVPYDKSQPPQEIEVTYPEQWDLIDEELQGAGVRPRTFGTGATRDTEEGKLDYEGFLSPIVLERYARYMHKNREQSDGSVRSADNWQKGIPFEVYMKSLWRHFMDVWTKHREMHGWEGWDGSVEELTDPYAIAFEEALCGVLFNTMGYLHELLKEQ